MKVTDLISLLESCESSTEIIFVFEDKKLKLKSIQDRIYPEKGTVIEFEELK